MEYQQFDENIFCDSEPTKDELIAFHECAKQMNEEISFYQPLFDFMRNQYGVILVASEMDDIIKVVKSLK